MNREQTLALWGHCEAAREEVRKSKSEQEAHIAATAIWNEWAEEMLKQRVLLSKSGKWQDDVKSRNAETQAWQDAAAVVFSTADMPHKFEGDLRCDEWIFPGSSTFTQAIFQRRASFHSAMFKGPALFGGASFCGFANFERAQFCNRSIFSGSVFFADARFINATFSYRSVFYNVTFDGYAMFYDARFKKGASFQAIRSSRAFALERAVFKEVPNFTQASFLEAPRLDNLKIDPKIDKAEGRKSGPAYYRTLRRIAIQGQDHDQAQAFLAGEIKSARYVMDWPLPFRFWRSAEWSGFFRYWFGMLYQLFSDFGRSLVRPVLGWFIVLTLSSIAYLGETPDVVRQRAALSDGGVASAAEAYSKITFLRWVHGLPCISGLAAPLRELPEAIRHTTDSVSEAVRLSTTNALVIGDIGGSEAARRTYGCLYGLERDGDNSIPIIPGVVSDVAKFQKILSGVFIFLFGLALRNMLRLK